MIPYYDSLTPNAISDEQLDRLLSWGWFRSNQKIFTCSHVDLNGIYPVHWLRFAVASIQERPSHKRLRKRNKKFSFSIEEFNVTSIRPDHVELYKRYRASITFDGADSIEESLLGENFNGHTIFNTRCISIFNNGYLIAGGYFDIGKKSAASILHFFDPRYAQYSLGKFLILLTVDYLREHNFWYYYPGYVVQGLPKMNYKLFLGKGITEYFDPVTAGWKNFQESILEGGPIDLNTFRNQILG